MATPLELLQGGVAQKAVPRPQPTQAIPINRSTATVAQTPTSGSYTQSTDGQQLDPSIVAMAKAIRQHETGNQQKTGATGETKSKYQFLPDTWRIAAQKYLGDANAPITGINEDKVAYAQIKEWKDKGYKPSQIAAAWNGGEGVVAGDRWKQMVGVNEEYGVKYDVPGYVNKVLANYEKEKQNYLSQQQAQQEVETQKAQELPGISQDARNILGNGAIGNVVGAATDFGLGAVQQTGKILGGMSSLGERFLRGTLKTLLPKSAEQALGIQDPSNQVPMAIEQSKTYQDTIKPLSKAQQVGQTATEIGSYVLPGTSALKIGKAAEAGMIGGKLLKGAAKLGATGLAETALGTGISGVNAGKIGAEQFGSGVVQGVASLVLPPVFSGIGKAYKNLTTPLVKRVEQSIAEMTNKAIKPFYGSKPVNIPQYNKQVSSVVDTISKVLPKNELPKDTVSLYNGVKKAKDVVWSYVSQIRNKAGQAGLKFDSSTVSKKLGQISGDLGRTPEIRKTAKRMISEIDELNGLGPEIVQQRIQGLNEELATFFNKVTPKTSRQYVVAEISQLLRDTLDDQISTVIKNSGNKELLARYSALKTVEKDIWRQASAELKRQAKNNVGLYDLTDVYSNAELLVGLVLDSKESLIRGITGKTTKELLKYLSSGDRFIEKAFKEYLEVLGTNPKKILPKTPINFTNTESKVPIQNLNLPRLGTGKVTEKGIPIPLKAPGQSNLGVTEVNSVKKATLPKKPKNLKIK